MKKIVFPVCFSLISSICFVSNIQASKKTEALRMKEISREQHESDRDRNEYNEENDTVRWSEHERYEKENSEMVERNKYGEEEFSNMPNQIESEKRFDHEYVNNAQSNPNEEHEFYNNEHNMNNSSYSSEQNDMNHRSIEGEVRLEREGNYTGHPDYNHGIQGIESQHNNREDFDETHNAEQKWDETGYHHNTHVVDINNNHSNEEFKGSSHNLVSADREENNQAEHEYLMHEGRSDEKNHYSGDNHEKIGETEGEQNKQNIEKEHYEHDSFNKEGHDSYRDHKPTVEHTETKSEMHNFENKEHLRNENEFTNHHSGDIEEADDLNSREKEHMIKDNHIGEKSTNHLNDKNKNSEENLAEEALHKYDNLDKKQIEKDEDHSMKRSSRRKEHYSHRRHNSHRRNN